MPKGSHLADAETIEKRLQKRAENRKELQSFFVHINDTLRVTRDNYNVIIISKGKQIRGGNMLILKDTTLSLNLL